MKLITKILLLALLVFLFCESLAQSIIKYNFQDNGTELSIGQSVKLVSAGTIDTTTQSDSEYIGIVFAKETYGSNRYYSVANSGVFDAYLKAGVTVGDLLTTASG